MYCTSCGLQMDEDAAFCSRCGKATGATPVARAVSPRRLSRPMYDKKIAGVCAGFARYLDMDVTLLRVLWLIIAFTTGVGFVAYVIAWICMPREDTPVAASMVQST